MTPLKSMRRNSPPRKTVRKIDAANPVALDFDGGKQAALMASPRRPWPRRKPKAAKEKGPTHVEPFFCCLFLSGQAAIERRTALLSLAAEGGCASAAAVGVDGARAGC